MKKAIIDEAEICRRYLETNDGIAAMAKEMHTNKDRVREVLQKNGIEIKKKGKQPLRDVFVVSDWKIEKYPEKDGIEYVAVDRQTGYETKDVNNRGGFLTTHIEKEYGVQTPTLYDRRLYYMRTGNYWWEQWFEIVERPKKATKKCAYCDWETEDIENRSGAYEVHLRNVHGISKLDYLKEHPEEKPYFTLVSSVLNRQMSDDKDDYVVCKVCGKKLGILNSIHLKKHNMTRQEYFEKFGLKDIISKKYRDTCTETAKIANMNMTFHKVSAAEMNICNFIKDLGFEVQQNTRKILEGKEIDIYLPLLKIGFEYNGLFYHTEEGGKQKYYHQKKTNLAESKGVKLYQIFEDEYVHKKDVLFYKIRHILNKDNGVKINARDCIVKEIEHQEAMEFIENYHIQGFGNYCTVYLGAFWNEKLVGVMTFIEELPGLWNLTRFATDYHYQCRGIGGKLFKHFIRSYKYKLIKTFADRRWTSTIGENLYDKLGFARFEIQQPTYTLYSRKNHLLLRFHRSNFRKNHLMKMFGFDKNMTGEEMLSELGYSKIWDCGLIKYVYINTNDKEALEYLKINERENENEE